MTASGLVRNEQECDDAFRYGRFTLNCLQFPYRVSLTWHGRVENFHKFVQHHTVFLTYKLLFLPHI
jgi:hypothetical protein